MARTKKVVEHDSERYLYDREKEHLNPPTYKFNVGDRVLYGAFSPVFVTEVLDDGYGYRLSCTKTNEDRLGNKTEETVSRIASWVQVRPIIRPFAPCYTRDRGLHLDFFTTTIESLFSYKYGFGIDMEPDYQRDYVWNDDDKEALLDSIFNDYDIGKFVLIRREDDYDIGYEICDGKQRLSTLLDFYENRLPYKGYYYNELCGTDKYTFKCKSISMAIVSNATDVDKLKIFLSINTNGRVMDKEHLNKVKEMLEEIS